TGKALAHHPLGLLFQTETHFGAQLVTFVSDGVLAVTDVKGKLSLCEPVSGKSLHPLENPSGLPYVCVVASSDGRMLAATDFKGSIRVWEAATGKELRRLVWPAPPKQSGGTYWLYPTTLAFAPDGKTLAALGLEGRQVRPVGETPKMRLRVWEL